MYIEQLDKIFEQSLSVLLSEIKHSEKSFGDQTLRKVVIGTTTCRTPTGRPFTVTQESYREEGKTHESKGVKWVDLKENHATIERLV